MKKIILVVLMMTTMFLLFACKDKDDEIIYNKEEGVASGKVELSGKEPKINISNIKAKKGTDIDYLSGVVIEDEEQYEDLKVWVDASAVDIYEPGDYKAKYTFEYDGKSIKYEITVTITDEQVEESAGEVATTTQSANVGNVVGNETETITQNVVDNETVGQNTTSGTEKESTTKNSGSSIDVEPTTKPQATTKPQVTTKPQATTKPQTTTKPQVTTKPQATTTKQQATGNNSNTETTKRELITSTGNATTKVVNIGYAYIELLSGSTVSIKTTTAKYIVSTRTDVSYTTKNGVEYKVSKLIITYNTGEERTLETVEEKCN